MVNNVTKYLTLFFRRIIKDFQQKQLLPLKLLFFIHASTIYVIYPYLTIHMRELGINVEETAIMSAITPVVAILMPPVAGMIADKIGNFKLLLSIFSTLGGLSALLFMIVPTGRITLTYPNEVIFGVSCNSGSPLALSLYQQHPCTPIQSHTFSSEIKMLACGFVCQAVTDVNDTNAIFNTKSYGIQIYNKDSNKTTTLRYSLLPEDIYVPTALSKVRNHKTLKNNERYRTAIRKFSRNSYFFPTDAVYNFSCELAEYNSADMEYNVTMGEKVVTDDDEKYSCIFGSREETIRMKKKLPVQFQAGISALKMNENEEYEELQSYKVSYIEDTNKYKTSCNGGFLKSGERVSVNVPLYDSNEEIYKNLNLGSCAPRCIASSPRKSVCSNPNRLVEIDMQLTFWSYLFVRVLIGIISGTSFAMFEGAVIAILREHKADYGLQRIYATVGGMISSPLSGWLIDFASRGKGYTDFRPIFFLYAALKIIGAVLMLFINLEFKTPATNVVSDVISVLKKAELIALFVACFVLGIAWGYIESFLFWLIQDLGGSKSLMGITITVGGIAGIPLLVLSGPIIKRLGHANVIFIGFIFYAIRLLGYSLIYNPWLCLIFEAMESITSSLSFTAAVTYAAKLSTVTTDTSIQGMLGGLYYGVGKGAGSLMGGFLMKAFGTRVTYRIFAASTAITGVIYFCFYHYYLKHRPSEGEDITQKSTKKVPQDFVEIDLKKVPSTNIQKQGNVLKGEALPYEDAITNLGYEETEFENDEQKDGDKRDV